MIAPGSADPPLAEADAVADGAADPNVDAAGELPHRVDATAVAAAIATPLHRIAVSLFINAP